MIFTGCGQKEPSISERVAQAEGLLDAGQIESALILLEEAESRDPGRVDVLEPLAFAYAASGDPTLAALTFARMAEIAPERAEYLVYAAQSLLEAGDRKGAAAQYEAYLKLRPRDRAVWVTLAERYRESGQLNAALDAYLSAEQVAPRPVQQVAIGELYLRRDNFAQAQVWFAQAASLESPERSTALLGLLETAIRGKRFSDAEALVEQLDREFPGRLDQSPLNTVREQLAEWQERREAAREALADLETRESTLATEAVEAPEASATDALPLTEPALDREVATVEDPSAEEGTAIAVATPETAAIEPDPVEPEAAEVTEPGSPVESTGGTVATPEAPTEDRVAPAVSGDRQELARSALEQAREERNAGNLASAIKAYKQSLLQDDSQDAVWAELSAAYLDDGQARWAQATASEAMRRDPENPSYVLAYLRTLQGETPPDRLLREMESAHRRFPDNPGIVLVLARAYGDSGNTRNERLLLQRFLEISDSSHPERATVESELGPAPLTD
jgi:tetratricopeptide (TPR) repeat protein